jgi:2-iminobutanoate/2-iminopropanoate deaminase
MALILHNPDMIAPPARGLYSHAIEVASGTRHLFVAGQVGVRGDGNISSAFADQVNQMMSNIQAVLASAGMDFKDIVKFNAYCMNAANIIAYADIRNRWLGAHRPATTAVVVSGLANPEWLIEADLVAARGERSHGPPAIRGPFRRKSRMNKLNPSALP